MRTAMGRSSSSWWSRRAALSALALSVSAPGCSVLFDTSADQCSIDADCEPFGAELPLCRAGLCVARDAGSAGEDGSGAGANAGGEGGRADAECQRNGDCIDAHFGQPYLCRAGECVALTNDDCPLVVGAQNLRAPEPIVFGAYALAPDAVSRSVVTRNLDLAVSEFTAKVTGLRGGANGSRTLAFVVCNSYFPEVAPGTIDAFAPSLSHLLDDVRVPGIVSALSAKDLQAVFAQRLDAAGVFVISAFEQDSELSALTDGGRLWNMLGPTADLAPAFAPLLKRTEAHLRKYEEFLNISEPGGKLRTAIVTANIARETDIRDALADLPELDDFEVEQFQIESALLTEDPDVSSVAADLIDFAPNIIVALAGSEFVEQVFPALESGSIWSERTGGQRRPMYVLSSTMAPETWSLYAPRQGDAGGWNSFFDRIVGVAYASAADTELRDDYEARLTGANKDLPDPSVLLGSESVYDAAYLMIYAAAAAGQVPSLSGKDLARGMLRLISGTSYDVGPTPISKVLTALDNGDDLGLRLTLGEPDWNAAQGTRRGVGSVYCLNNGMFAYEGEFPLGPNNDQLRFDPTGGTLETKPLSCINGF